MCKAPLVLRLLEARKIEEEEASAAIEEAEAKEAKAAEEATEVPAGARAAKGAKERADLADRVRRIDAKPKGWKGAAREEVHGAATSFIASALRVPLRAALAAELEP